MFAMSCGSLTDPIIENNAADPFTQYSLIDYDRQLFPTGSTEDWDEHFKEVGNLILTWDGDEQRRHIFYSGYQGESSGDNAYVGRISSLDGKDWARHGKLIERPLEDPYVVSHGGTYYLYAEDKQDIPFRNIRLYTSSDLINWEDQGDILDISEGEWDGDDVSSQVVWVEQGTWYMLYEGRTFRDTNTVIQGGAIGLATSTDGVHWDKSADNPVVIPAGEYFSDRAAEIKWAISIVPDDIRKIGEHYYLLFHGDEHGQGFKPGTTISTDLLAWSDPLNRPVEVFGLDQHVSMLMYYTEDLELPPLIPYSLFSFSSQGMFSARPTR